MVVSVFQFDDGNPDHTILNQFTLFDDGTYNFIGPGMTVCINLLTAADCLGAPKSLNNLYAMQSPSFTVDISIPPTLVFEFADPINGIGYLSDAFGSDSVYLAFQSVAESEKATCRTVSASVRPLRFTGERRARCHDVPGSRNATTRLYRDVRCRCGYSRIRHALTGMLGGLLLLLRRKLRRGY